MIQEHVDILKRSVEEWNKWRNERWDIKPDLSGADLRGLTLFKINLDGVNLSSANLRNAELVNISAIRANFEGANLDGAMLQGSNFNLSNFYRANMRGASLIGSSLTECSIREANLSKANCTSVNFLKSDLSGAIFYDAVVDNANFEATNVEAANLHIDQFRKAVIPIETMSRLERRKKRLKPYVSAFINLSLIFLIFLGVYLWIGKAEGTNNFRTKLKANLYFQVAECFEIARQYDKAIVYIDKSIQYNPNNPKPYFLAGSIYRRERKSKEAVRYFQKFIDLKPGSQEAKNLEEFMIRNR